MSDTNLPEQSQNESLSDTQEEKRVGNFILGKTIGEGGFGKVKIGIHTYTKEQVAVKILNKSKMVDEEDLINVQKEISILKQLRHKNIVQLYEIIETDEKLYIFMELAEKGDLFDKISKSGKLDELTACRYFHQIISSLEYIHTMNISHRDIKPENMLIDYNDEIKLSDFGLSSHYNSQDNLMNTPCGTPMYASPELLKGESYHGMFNDIWSAGVILYAMITGCLPYDNTNEDKLLDKIIYGKYITPRKISSDAADLISKILVKDPAKRYDFEQIKKHKWFHLCQFVFCPGIIVNYHKMPVDEKILKFIENIYHEDQNKIRENLKTYEFNSLTTTYFLMLKKFLKEGGKSVSDLKSNEYISYITNPENVEIILPRNPQSDDYLDIKIKPSFDKRLARASILELNNQGKIKFLLNMSEIEKESQSDDDDSDEEEEDALSEAPFTLNRKTVIKRTSNIYTNIFLDILQKKAKNEFEQSNDNKKIQDYIKKRKSLLVTHQKSTVKMYKDNNAAKKPVQKKTVKILPKSPLRKNESKQLSDQKEKQKKLKMKLDIKTEKETQEKKVKKAGKADNPEIKNKTNKIQSEIKKNGVQSQRNENILQNKPIVQIDDDDKKRRYHSDNKYKQIHNKLQIPVVNNIHVKKNFSDEKNKEKPMNQRNKKNDSVNSFNSFLYKSLTISQEKTKINNMKGIILNRSDFKNKPDYAKHIQFSKIHNKTNKNQFYKSYMAGKSSNISIELQSKNPNPKIRKKYINLSINLNNSSINKFNYKTTTHKDKELLFTNREELVKFSENCDNLSENKETTKNSIEIKNSISLQSYSGLIDLIFCFYIEKSEFINKLTNSMKKSKIIYVLMSNEKYSCTKDHLKFKIEVMVLPQSEIIYLQVVKKYGNITEFRDLIYKLLQEININ